MTKLIRLPIQCCPHSEHWVVGATQQYVELNPDTTNHRDHLTHLLEHELKKDAFGSIRKSGQRTVLRVGDDKRFLMNTYPVVTAGVTTIHYVQKDDGLSGGYVVSMPNELSGNTCILGTFHLDDPYVLRMRVLRYIMKLYGNNPIYTPQEGVDATKFALERAWANYKLYHDALMQLQPYLGASCIRYGCDGHFVRVFRMGVELVSAIMMRYPEFDVEELVDEHNKVCGFSSVRISMGFSIDDLNPNIVGDHLSYLCELFIRSFNKTSRLVKVFT